MPRRCRYRLQINFERHQVPAAYLNMRGRTRMLRQGLQVEDHARTTVKAPDPLLGRDCRGRHVMIACYDCVQKIVQVEAHARMTVKEIFEQEGEEAFREVETAVLQVRIRAIPSAVNLRVPHGHNWMYSSGTVCCTCCHV